MELFGYQKEAVGFIGETKTAYLALDMGMGKTLTALSAAAGLAKKNVLVIAEKNEIVNSENFKREVETHFPGRFQYYSLRDKETPPIADYSPAYVCGINPDGLKKIDEDFLLKCFDFVIIDEATMAKTTTTDRFKVVYKICKKMPHVVLLSGTPMMNGAAELWAPLLLLDHPITGDKTAKDRMAFEKIFAGGGYKQIRSIKNQDEEYVRKHWWMFYAWSAKGANRVRELRYILRDKFFIMQKGQTDVFKKKTRSTVMVPMSLEWLSEYTNAWDEYYDAFDPKRQEALDETMEDYAGLRRIIENGKMYQVNSHWKAKRVAQDIVDGVYGDRRIVVFSMYIETDQIIQSELGRHGISWRTFEDVKEWKQGAEQVLIGRIKAHGKGGNAAEASVCLMVDMDFVPANNIQAENRIDRPEQKNDMDVVYYLTEGEDVVDHHVRAINKDKARKIDEFMRPFTDEELAEMPAKLVELRAKFPRECERLGI